MSIRRKPAKLPQTHNWLLSRLCYFGTILEPLYIALSRSREPQNILLILIHERLRIYFQSVLEVLHAPINQLKSSAQEIQLWFNTQQEG